MIGGLSHIDSLFSGHVGFCPTPSRPVPNQASPFAPYDGMRASAGNSEHSPILPNGTTSAETGRPEKTDNARPAAQSENLNKQPHGFNPPAPERTTTAPVCKAEDGRNTGKKGPLSTAAEQPKIVQLWLAQYSLNAQHGKEGFAKKVEPKAGRQLAQLLAASMAEKSPYAAAKGPENPLQSIAQDEKGPKDALPATSRNPLTAIPLPEEGNNATVMPISNKARLATTVLTSSKSPTEPTPEALLNARPNMPTDTERPSIAQTTQSFTHHQTLLANKELTPDVPFSADGKTATHDGQQPGSNAQKTPALNINLSEAQPESSKSSSPPFPAAPEESPDASEKPANNAAAANKMTPELSAEHDKASRPAANAITPGSHPNKLNIAEPHTSAGQTKDHGNPTSPNSSGPGFEPTVLNNTQPPVSEPFSDAPAQAARTNDNTAPGPAPAGISDQILESIHSSLRQGQQQITIRLNPPELGKVLIKLQEQQDQITGLLEVTKIQTRYEIEHEIPNMIRTLQDAGIQIKRLEVVVSDQPEQEPFRDQSPHLGSFQQDDFAAASDHHKNSADEWLTTDADFQETAEPQILTADGSITMLV